MLQVERIAQDKKNVITRLKVKNFDASKLVEEIITLNEDRKRSQGKLDNSLAQMNTISKEVGILFGKGEKDQAEARKQETVTLKETTARLKEQHRDIEDKLQQLLIQLPNIPHESVPEGKSAEENEITFEVDFLPDLGEGAKAHWDLAEHYDFIDFELGNKITGAGFPVYKGKGAKLQRALINFFLDQAIAAGYQEIMPPLMVNEASAYGTGQLPDKEGQMYRLKDDPFYLIPTAEVPITNVYRDEILDSLPVKMVGYTPCFRREAGSYGKDVRGLNRLHQFDKVEIVQIQHPDKSYETLDEMVDYVRGLLEKLELPYRVARLCGGDISFASALTFDLEVYSAGQKRWLEVSSVSNFESFQSSRMNIRFSDGDKKKSLVHTLNGSALALPRIMSAIIENNQTEEGINIPKVLRPYTGFDVLN